MHPSSFWAMILCFGMFAFIALCAFVLLCAVALISGAIKGYIKRIKYNKEMKHIDDADKMYEDYLISSAGSVHLAKCSGADCYVLLRKQ